MYCIDALDRQSVMLCLCEREMQLCDTERQRYREAEIQIDIRRFNRIPQLQI